MRIFVGVLAVIGVIFVILIVALFGFGMLAVNKAKKLVGGAEAYADETIADFGKEWDPQTLLKRGAPEFLAAVEQNPAALQTLSEELRNGAGPLLSAEPATCDDFRYEQSTAGRDVFVADCRAAGTTGAGPADFKLSLVNREDAWALIGIQVLVTATEPTARTTQVLFRPAAAAPDATAFAVTFRTVEVGFAWPPRVVYRKGDAVPGLAPHAEAAPMLVEQFGSHQ